MPTTSKQILLTLGLFAIGVTGVDIVLLTNAEYAIGAAAIINAVRHHTPSPSRFWIGYDGEPSELRNYLECVGVNLTSVTIRQPLEVLSNAQLQSTAVAVGKERLRSAANFARFALPKLFPELAVAWYFDGDVLPMRDLTTPTREFEVSSVKWRASIRPVIRPGTIAKQFPDRMAIASIYSAMYKRTINLGAPSWNAGVWLANFDMWRQRDIAKEAAAWIDRKNSFKGLAPLWKLATQPLMYLLFNSELGRKGSFLPPEWNCEIINLKSDPGQNPPPGCSVLHWNGADKPWDPAAPGHKLWARYLPRFADARCRSPVTADSVPDSVVSHTPSTQNSSASVLVVRTPPISHSVPSNHSATVTVGSLAPTVHDRAANSSDVVRSNYSAMSVIYSESSHAENPSTAVINPGLKSDGDSSSVVEAIPDLAVANVGSGIIMFVPAALLLLILYAIRHEP
jgi:lipopolysaccharide biosynthesis glycosyltransferase